jgi:hypothetical protein
MPSASTVFVDTYMLVYAASWLPEDAAKSARALELLDTESISLSFQVLQEFYANAIHPRKLRLTPEKLRLGVRHGCETPLRRSARNRSSTHWN